MLFSKRPHQPRHQRPVTPHPIGYESGVIYPAAWAEINRPNPQEIDCTDRRHLDRSVPRPHWLGTGIGVACRRPVRAGIARVLASIWRAVS